MSLDVYLEGEPTMRKCTCRECGYEHESKRKEEFYQANITHNLGGMAHAAGIYKVLWRPEELGIERAEALIDLLKTGLDRLLAEPDKFKQHNDPSRCGTYEQFVPFVQKYLGACMANPTARVRVSR